MRQTIGTFFLLGMLFLSTACSENDKIEQAVTRFYTAFYTGEFETAKKYGTPSSIEYIENLQKLLNKPLLDKIKASEITLQILKIEKAEPKEGEGEKPEEAIVTCEITGNWNLLRNKFPLENKSELKVRVVKTDRKWLVVFP